MCGNPIIKPKPRSSLLPTKTLVIKCTYLIPYLYRREGNRQYYLARLDEVDKIAKVLNLPKERAIDVLIPLIESRVSNTRKVHVRRVLNETLAQLRSGRMLP
jgi:hypothetical protein